MSKEKLNELLDARAKLCRFCENDAYAECDEEDQMYVSHHNFT